MKEMIALWLVVNDESVGMKGIERELQMQGCWRENGLEQSGG